MHRVRIILFFILVHTRARFLHTVILFNNNIVKAIQIKVKSIYIYIYTCVYNISEHKHIIFTRLPSYKSYFLSLSQYIPTYVTSKYDTIFFIQTIIVCKGIIEAVHIHKRAIEFSEFLWSTLAVSYSIMLIFGITSLLINLFCLFQTILFIKETNELIMLIVFNIGHFFYLFLGNYVGQILIDHSAAQKLLPMIIQRSMRSCKMVVGGMFYNTTDVEYFELI
ncbi:Odorant receptor 424 [Nylanderia fulva]|uniref:Odorant receptor 424 n=1 Tax=Nylanderia fulva TaxID=613905 RepID=A0A6G1LQM8_9HYME|nr:Odorant receptor 424 [Nylanderia fulva]